MEETHAEGTKGKELRETEGKKENFLEKHKGYGVEWFVHIIF